MLFIMQGLNLSGKVTVLYEKGRVCSLNQDITSNLKIGDSIVEIDSHYFRPAEVDYLLADVSKARDKLGWEPKVTFKELVKIMVDADMEMIGINPPGEGKKILHDKGIYWTTNQVAML